MTIGDDVRSRDEWAVVTGASSGIGLELSRLFGRHGFKVALVARGRARLEALAAELRSREGVETMVVPADLAQPGAPELIFEQLCGKDVSVLVNNAGFGLCGPFAEADLGKSSDLMQVNMTALMQLTHRFVQPMIARRGGRILNVASIAAFLPGPTANLYYASKAFVYSFSYALAMELEPKGISVTVLCPGTTHTEFFKRAGMRVRPGYPMMSARAVAEAGFRGMMRGRRVVIPGFTNKLMATVVKRLPPGFPASFVSKIHVRDETGNDTP